MLSEKTWNIKRYKFNQLSRTGISRGTERNMECFLWAQGYIHGGQKSRMRQCKGLYMMNILKSTELHTLERVVFM